jgi:hypothetical protein
VLQELLRRRHAGRLAGGIRVDFEREALAARIDRGQRAGAVGFGVGAVGVFGVLRGLLGHVSGERGNGLLAAQNGDLDVGSGAFPRDGVVAGVQRLTFDVDLFVQLERALVGVAGENGRREEKRRTEKCESEFREFHQISFQISTGTLRRSPHVRSAGEFQIRLSRYLTRGKNGSYENEDAKNAKE